ncbi:hypothetical protein BAUCODRAFT_150469 [Baudoinia panamericana UAMH 10762]|uniref:Exonuclease domain-containing protein n=1 Tax=Baudoinia panamericana (strain UAMH 10762) TaxID=717646 RepID=M2MS04_BAUPA|nr:uncharacterized protein BAUCODRAFT_150469 [Baudoinia panamericana UAMH 10762]EMC94283.1 hypothetical protein BAUCODRAFT_150469 [Baudoinia panamericana UAMH 10762]
MPVTVQPAGTTTTVRPKRQPKTECRATQVVPLFEKLKAGEPVFIDMEFQDYKVAGEKQHHRIGRVAIINHAGEVVLDVFPAYRSEPNVKKILPPRRFGVNWSDLYFDNGAVPAEKVERWVKEMVKDRTVVVHGGTHDLTAFYIEQDVWATSTIVDTQWLYSGVAGNSKPSLLDCVESELGLDHFRSGGEHSPVEDAEATRQLYLRAQSGERKSDDAKVDEGDSSHYRHGR